MAGAPFMSTICEDHQWGGMGPCPRCEVEHSSFIGLQKGVDPETRVFPITQSKDPLGKHYMPERLEDETTKEYAERVNRIRRLLQPHTSMYNIETVEHLLTKLTPSQKESYISALREVVKGPGIGGSGQYLGSLVPMVFATKEQKLQAVLLMERWEWDAGNK